VRLYDTPNPAAESQTPAEIGKTNILDQRRRIERQRELMARLERDGSPDLVAEAVRDPRRNGTSARSDGGPSRRRAGAAATVSVDEPNSAKAEPLR
jgi:predicted ABC-class ATPase